ncbi:MAG: alanine racemase [Treponemataceae bacterium]
MRATKAIIHLENLKHNIFEVKKLINADTKLCMPVKADAYGHGAVEVAKIAIQSGIYCLAVATVDEGIELRKAGIDCPILLFTLPCFEEIANVCSYDITPFVFDEYYIDELQRVTCRLGKTLKVFIKVDSGMGRIGCESKDALKIAKKIITSTNLRLCGIATHLCVSDCIGKDDADFTSQQILDFEKAINSIKNSGINPGIVTCSASGGVLLYSGRAQFDMVRPGIIFYGYYPDKSLKDYIEYKYGNSPSFKPVMELKTKIEAIKKVSAGTSISYGRTWIAQKDTYIATLPIGYADGLLRSFSGKLSVRIGEKMYPIVGRICMDQCMVDLGDNPCNIGTWDDVSIFGLDKIDNTAETLAKIAGTISYEITCLISKRVPREYVK